MDHEAVAKRVAQVPVVGLRVRHTSAILTRLRIVPNVRNSILQVEYLVRVSLEQVKDSAWQSEATEWSDTPNATCNKQWPHVPPPIPSALHPPPASTNRAATTPPQTPHPPTTPYPAAISGTMLLASLLPAPYPTSHADTLAPAVYHPPTKTGLAIPPSQNQKKTSSYRDLPSSSALKARQQPCLRNCSVPAGQNRECPNQWLC